MQFNYNYLSIYVLYNSFNWVIYVQKINIMVDVLCIGNGKMNDNIYNFLRKSNYKYFMNNLFKSIWIIELIYKLIDNEKIYG